MKARLILQDAIVGASVQGEVPMGLPKVGSGMLFLLGLCEKVGFAPMVGVADAEGSPRSRIHVGNFQDSNGYSLDNNVDGALKVIEHMPLRLSLVNASDLQSGNSGYSLGNSVDGALKVVEFMPPRVSLGNASGLQSDIVPPTGLSTAGLIGSPGYIGGPSGATSGLIGDCNGPSMLWQWRQSGSLNADIGQGGNVEVDLNLKNFVPPL